MNAFLQSTQVFTTDPFPHFAAPKALEAEQSLKVLAWLETSAPWKLKVAAFYEQYEFSLLHCELPSEIRPLFSVQSLADLRHWVEHRFETRLDDRQDVTAHKLIRGQRIRIHNDFIPGRETHRVLVQLNRGWQDAYGGILMFFGSDDPNDIRKAFRPVHNSCVGFEISEASHHAVAPIEDGERYTLVFSFYARNR